MAAVAAAALPAPAVAAGDPGEVAGDPLDLRAAVFEQVGTQLSLVVRTREGRLPGGPEDGSLCVTLLRGRPVGQLCASVGASRRPVVRYRHAWRRRPRYGRFARVRGAEVERRGRV